MVSKRQQKNVLQRLLSTSASEQDLLLLVDFFGSIQNICRLTRESIIENTPVSSVSAKEIAAVFDQSPWMSTCATSAMMNSNIAAWSPDDR